MLSFKEVVIFVTVLSLLLFLSISCTSDKESQNVSLFQSLSSKRTHIAFKNSLTETDTFNYFLYSYIYMGGGVSVGDFNNDGMTDIYFTGNMESNRLYLNKGNLELMFSNRLWCMVSFLSQVSDSELPTNIAFQLSCR